MSCMEYTSWLIDNFYKPNRFWGHSSVKNVPSSDHRRQNWWSELIIKNELWIHWAQIWFPKFKGKNGIRAIKCIKSESFKASWLLIGYLEAKTWIFHFCLRQFRCTKKIHVLKYAKIKAIYTRRHWNVVHWRDIYWRDHLF